MTGNGDADESGPGRAQRTPTAARRGTSGPSAGTVSARGVLATARELGSELGWSWEALSGLRREGDGWTVAMDVVETRRVPSTTDLIAVYEVDFDGAGELLGYRRLRHYVRGRGDNERDS
jgi:hypothetical protein